MTVKKRTSPERERDAADEVEAAAATPREAPPAGEAPAVTVVEVTSVVSTTLPRIDEYVEDLIDPELGMAPGREAMRAAAKKMSDGFNGILKEMVATVPARKRDDREH